MAKGTGQSAKEFISRLRAGSVHPPVTLIGIVKPSEGDSEQSLMFSSGGCEDWVEIPEKAISEIQTLGLSPCKDHQHPRVRIELAQSDDPTIAALSAVLAHVVSSKRSEPMLMQHSTVHPHPVTAGQQPPFGQRQYFRLMSGGAVCPSAHPNCYGGISNCQYGCACCDGGGECFCSTCCIS